MFAITPQQSIVEPGQQKLKDSKTVNRLSNYSWEQRKLSGFISVSFLLTKDAYMHRELTVTS